MKWLLGLLVVLLFITSAAYPQIETKRNECRRFIGKSTHKDFITNENTIPTHKFDSARFCNAVMKLYENLNLDVITGKEDICLLGYSKGDANEYSISFVHCNNMIYFNITNTSAPYKVYTNEEYMAIRRFQLALTERFLKAVRSYL